MRRVFAALAFGALAALAACQLVVGLERPRDDAPAAEGGSEADGSAGDAGAPDASPAFLCLRAFAPMPPKSADGPDPVRAYVLATRGFAFRNQAGAMPAVDMDCIDTRCEGGDTSPSSCKPAGGPLPICDEPGGIDNQGGHSLLANFIFNSAKPVGGAEIARGLYGELIWLFNYNGLADDPAVRVAFVPSPGFDAYEPLQCVSGVFDLIDAGYTGDGGDGGDAGYEQYVGDASVPRWNGCDRWHVDAKYAASVSPFTSLNGYVRDSVLYVPPVEGATLPLTLGVSIATFQTPGIIAPLERFAFDGAPITDGGAASFVRIRQGKAFGRATTREILDFISRYRDNSGTCISRDGFQFAQTQLCGSEDLPSTSARVDQVCDAISFAVFFDGDPALHGEQREAGTAERCVSDRSAAELMDGSFLDCPQK